MCLRLSYYIYFYPYFTPQRSGAVMTVIQYALLSKGLRISPCSIWSTFKWRTLCCNPLCAAISWKRPLSPHSRHTKANVLTILSNSLLFGVASFGNAVILMTYAVELSLKRMSKVPVSGFVTSIIWPTVLFDAPRICTLASGELFVNETYPMSYGFNKWL